MYFFPKSVPLTNVVNIPKDHSVTLQLKVAMLTWNPKPVFDVFISNCIGYT